MNRAEIIKLNYYQLSSIKVLSVHFHNLHAFWCFNPAFFKAISQNALKNRCMETVRDTKIKSQESMHLHFS